jgi:hypothetical protein
MGVATATALIGTGISAFQAINGANQRKKAQQEMDNYERQELVNPSENIRLSTYGTDIQREDASRAVATFTDAARNAGIRGIYSALPKIQAKSNEVNQQIGQQLEKQDINRQYKIAQDEMRLMGIKENRDYQNLNAISSQWNASNQDFNQGLWGVASGVASAMRGLETDKENDDLWLKRR